MRSIAAAVFGLLLASVAFAQPATNARKARDFIVAGDFRSAVEVLRNPRDGDPDAQPIAAYLTMNGFVGAQDHEKARALAAPGAKSGNAIALYVLFMSNRLEQKDAEARKYFDPAFVALLGPALRGDVFATGLLAWLVYQLQAPVPDSAWAAAGDLAKRLPPEARKSPVEYFAAAAARNGFWLGYRALGVLDLEGKLDPKGFGPNSGALLALASTDEYPDGIRYLRRAALLGDRTSMRAMDDANFEYTPEKIAEMRKRDFGKNPKVDQETMIGFGMAYGYIQREFKGGQFQGNCAAATDGLDAMVGGMRRLKAPLSKLGIYQAMTATPPQALSEAQKQSLTQLHGGEGNLGALLVDFSASLHKLRIACDKDLFFPRMVRRLSD